MLNTKADKTKHLNNQDVLRKQIMNQFYSDYILLLQKNCRNLQVKKFEDIRCSHVERRKINDVWLLCNQKCSKSH